MTDTDTILAKLDALAEKDVHIFTMVEVADIKASIAFTKSFNGDPATLLDMSEKFKAVQGFVKVVRNVGLIVAFIVVLWANWERLIDLIRGGKP